MANPLGGLLVILASVGCGFGTLPEYSEDIKFSSCKETEDSVHNYRNYALQTGAAETMDQFAGDYLLVVNVASFWCE